MMHSISKTKILAKASLEIQIEMVIDENVEQIGKHVNILGRVEDHVAKQFDPANQKDKILVSTVIIKVEKYNAVEFR